MDEAGGCGCLILIVLVAVAWLWWGRGGEEPAGGETPPAVAPDVGPPPPGQAPLAWWPLGRTATLGLLGALYAAGLFLVRAAATDAKDGGASDQLAAIIGLSVLAFSPIVVPVVAVWSGLGWIGRRLAGPDEAGGDDGKPESIDEL